MGLGLITLASYVGAFAFGDGAFNSSAALGAWLHAHLLYAVAAYLFGSGTNSAIRGRQGFVASKNGTTPP
jgi:hypothetical protein